MKQRNVFMTTVAVFFIILALSGHSHAAFIQQSGWWDGDKDFYYEYDVGGFTFSVDFELYQEDDGSGLYQYQYTIQNTDDASDAAFQTMALSFPGGIVDADTVDGAGWNVGAMDVTGSTVTVGFNPISYLPEGETSDMFYVESYQAPVLSSLMGEGYGTALGGDSVPAAGPVPEPASVLLMVSGLSALFGLNRKKLKKLI